MSKKKPYRRKNRLIKLYLDIPEEYEDDEAFAEDFMDEMDEVEWTLVMDGQHVPINKIVIGDVEIGPEEEE